VKEKRRATNAVDGGEEWLANLLSKDMSGILSTEGAYHIAVGAEGGRAPHGRSGTLVPNIRRGN
jgi:hypothetical protein